MASGSVSHHIWVDDILLLGAGTAKLVNLVGNFFINKINIAGTTVPTQYVGTGTYANVNCSELIDHPCLKP